MSQLHYDRKNDLAEVFREYRHQPDVDGLCDETYEPLEERSQHFPSSIYFQIR